MDKLRTRLGVIAGLVMALPELSGGVLLARMGTLRKVRNETSGKVVWHSAAPDTAGMLALVLEEGLVVALSRVIESNGTEGVIELLDFHHLGRLRKRQEIQVMDVSPVPSAPEEGALLVWSDRPDSCLYVDGHRVGDVPALLSLSAGTHELLLDLGQGERAGAIVTSEPGGKEILFLTGRRKPLHGAQAEVYLDHCDVLPDPREGLFYFRRVPDSLIRSWVETEDGARIYSFLGHARRDQKTRIPPIPGKEAYRPYVPSGKVVAEIVLGADGRVGDLRVIAASSAKLAQSALGAWKGWKEEPPRLEGEPVSTLLLVGLRSGI